jgi:hypothetical protein
MLRIKESEKYAKLIDKFLIIKFDNGQKTMGVLKEITPAGKLYIVGERFDAYIDPLADFICHAKEDRMKKMGDRSD